MDGGWTTERMQRVDGKTDGWVEELLGRSELILVRIAAWNFNGWVSELLV